MIPVHSKEQIVKDRYNGVPNSSYRIMRWRLQLETLILMVYLVLLSLPKQVISQNADSSGTSEILLRIYDETRGSQWKNNDGWKKNTDDFCDWFGVECHPKFASNKALRGHISSINLSENNLLGTISGNIWSLSFLTELNIRNNPELDITFGGIENADYLESIVLSNSGITSFKNIDDAKQLTKLHITDCALQGSIPHEIFGLNTLKELYANYNGFRKNIPSTIGNLSGLTHLFLYANEITGTLPKEFEKLTKMKYLVLSDNDMSGNLDPSIFNSMSQLEVLSLQRSDDFAKGGFSGPVPAFEDLPHLTELYLQNNQFSGTLPKKFISSSPRDKRITVDLRNNELKGVIQESSLDRFELMNIYLSGNQFTHISNNLCTKNGWMSGNIGNIDDNEESRCNAILCPVQTWAALGRWTYEENCKTCNSAKFMGMTECQDNTTNIQKKILIDFYNNMDGENWYDNKGWTYDDECSWSGIECENGEVVSIYLADNKLNGQFDRSIFSLKSMRALDLSQNFIDFIFDGIGDAISLQTLQLYNMDISSLEDIDQLKQTNIQTLNLNSNNLIGTIPDSIYELSTLKHLLISYNHLTGSISTQIGNLKNLKSFNAYGNGLSEQLPTELGFLSETLEELLLSENDFTGSIPEQLSSMIKLKELSIHQTTRTKKGLSGALPTFKYCAVLKTLHLNSNSLDGTLPNDFLQFSHVLGETIDVDLKDNEVSGSIPEDWKRFSMLKIDLTNNKITNFSDLFCSKKHWQEGDIYVYGCDAILCSRGEYNSYGRHVHDTKCKHCPFGGDVMGSTQCKGIEEEDTTLKILTQFYFSTHGNNWKFNDQWLSNSNFCEWHGLLCDNDGRVIKISLGDNGLTGTPSTDLFKLRYLKELDLEQNMINFDFNGIEEAVKLKILYLSDTKTTSILGIGKAKTLTSLHLTNNGLSGNIPVELCDLTNLEYLYMNFNKFSGRLPSKISNLVKLKELYLLHNSLTGQIPNAIGKLNKLHTLSLSENSFDGTLPRELNNLSHLKTLALQRKGPASLQNDGIGLTGSLLSFSSLPKLKKLYLGHNSLTGTIPHNFMAGVSDKSSEIEVDLISNSLTGTVPPALINLEKLSIYLAGNKLTGFPSGLCNKKLWMEGEVRQFGCDAILCQPGFYTEFGRRTTSSAKCKECTDKVDMIYWGSLECLNDADKERDILKSLFKHMGGKSWIMANNWLDPDISICEWKGITCKLRSKDKETVQAINLSNNGLNGRVPAQIFELPSLEEINLSGNDINFSFDGIEKATNLRYLTIDSMGLQSLEGLDKASGLIFLHANSNNFDTFPIEVLSLVNLEALYLSDNKLNVNIEDIFTLTNLYKLLYFQCENCGLKGNIPIWLWNLKTLKYLSLARNSLQGYLNDDLITNLNYLEYLDLSDQKSNGGISGTLPSFSSHKYLSEIYLDRNSITGVVPSNFLQSVIKVSIEVQLQNNYISGTLPDVFNRYDDLTLLLAGNRITNIDSVECDSSVLKTKWNDGDIKRFGCDGLMCPPGKYSSIGRSAIDYITCKKCDLDTENQQYYGNTLCGLVDDQQNYLKKLFNDLRGQEWDNNKNWLSDEINICDWYGIECDVYQNIRMIDLKENGLSGKVSNEIFNILTLEEINLKGNNIEFDLDGIEKVEKLKVLILSETNIVSIKGIGKAKALEALHLTSCNINKIPDDLYELTNLKQLFMNYNELEGSISSSIGDITSLENLFLFHNHLTGTIPTEIGALKELVMLVLGENKLSGSVPAELNNLPLLEIISLQREDGSSVSEIISPIENYKQEKGLTGKIPAFDNMPQLREVYLGSNSFTGTIPTSFVNRINDKEANIKIDLTMNQLIGSIPLELQRFGKLKIYLAGNKINLIDDSFCYLDNWMEGEVGANGCAAILCPIGTYNKYGRYAYSGIKCKPCPYTYTADYLGSTVCTPDIKKYNERDVLTMLYKSVGGEAWENNENWLDENVSICDWYGVDCSQKKKSHSNSQFVSRLNLSSNNLIGTVPPQLYQLKNLETLDVSNNNVNVELAGIGNSNLKQMYADSTEITSLIGIGQAQRLKILSLQNNDFQGIPIPEEIFEIESLEKLLISNSNIWGSIPTKIGRLVNLKQFYCHGNELTGEIPTEIGMLEKLKVLELSENYLVGTLPSEIQNLSNLENLFIDNFTHRNSGLSGPLLDFTGMKKLWKIYLGSNSLTGTLPETFLKDLSNVDERIYINLKSNFIEGNIPQSFSIFKQLNIELTDNHLSSFDPELCELDNWMWGNVGKYNCDAILCPVGTFNQYGRQSTVKDTCKKCAGLEKSNILGSSFCDTDTKKEERIILTEFFNTCGGKNWKNKNGWLDPHTDICDWYGIKCLEDNSVNSIELDNNNIVGILPKNIFRILNLERLWLYSNPVELKFDGISEAKNLISLLLDSTRLKSLDGIADASRLIHLDISFNNIVGILPEEISNLINIEKLYLGGNKFSGTIPSFTKLRKLKSLLLEDNMFHGRIPDFFNHPEMSRINFARNKLTGTIPTIFLHSVDVNLDIFIDLSSNLLSGTVPSELKRFQQTTIYLSNNLITGIDEDLCNKEQWNSRDVELFQCDGILCSPGTVSLTGRASQNVKCTLCSKAKFYGQSQCINLSSESGGQLLSSKVYISILLVTSLLLNFWVTL